MGRLAGRVAIVTGSSSGFGREIALTFAREGAKIVCSDIRRDPDPDGFEESADPTDKLIKDSGQEAIYVECDVANAEDVKVLVDTSVKSFGRMDIMVNNAGIYRSGYLMHEVPLEELELMLDINLKGTWHGCRHALTQFLHQGAGGKIINIVSTAGLRPYPLQSVYNTVKAAVANLTRSIALEYASANINVNGICPTACKTALFRPGIDDERVFNMIKNKIPMQRWGVSKDVADLALFLASDESNFITGTLIPLDGGETLSGSLISDFGVKL